MLVLPIIFPHVIELPRLHSGLRPSPVDPQHPQRVHGPLQHRHELLQRPQPNHIAKETNSSISFSSITQQTFINRLPRWWTSQPNSQRHLNVLHHLVLATEASSSTTSCCCCQTLLHHQEEDHELETPTTSSNNIPSTSRDPSILTPSSTSSTRLCSLPSAQPHPTSKGVKTEELISACELSLYYSSREYSAEQLSLIISSNLLD